MKGFKCLLEEGKVYEYDGWHYKIANGQIWYRSPHYGVGWKLDDASDIINGDFKEVQQEVPWQNALEAWVSGKKIMYEFENEEYEVGDGEVIDRELLSKAKWFIL